MIEAAGSSADDDDEPAPLAGNIRLLKGAVYIMGVMLVVGTIVLIAGIVWKASQLPAGAPGGFEGLDIAVAPGSVVRSVEIDGDRMAVTVAGEASEIVIVDLRRGEVVGRVRLVPSAPAAQ